MSESLKVTLTSEDSEQLRRQIFAMMSEAVQQMRENAIQAPEWIKGKTGLSTYLSVSTDTITNMVKLGLPEHHTEASPNIAFFKKSEVDNFILNDGFIK
ncbi:MAG: hypothetical protein ABF657_05735 [Lentilactobacillus diolivorans]|uniref:hypothetical protein n=1 Tax=Lentilactobacillus diolivorans TaxID=179838 RepID=UPI0039ECB6B7